MLDSPSSPFQKAITPHKGSKSGISEKDILHGNKAPVEKAISDNSATHRVISCWFVDKYKKTKEESAAENREEKYRFSVLSKQPIHLKWYSFDFPRVCLKKGRYFFHEFQTNARNYNVKIGGLLFNINTLLNQNVIKKLSQINHLHSHQINQVQLEPQQCKYRGFGEGGKQVERNNKKFYPVDEAGRFPHGAAGIKNNEWVWEFAEEPAVIEVDDAERSIRVDWELAIELKWKNDFSFMYTWFN